MEQDRKLDQTAPPEAGGSGSTVLALAYLSDNLINNGITQLTCTVWEVEVSIGTLATVPATIVEVTTTLTIVNVTIVVN